MAQMKLTQAATWTPAKGPHPSFVEVARPYYFEPTLNQCMLKIGVTEAKEDSIRLAGVLWIDSVRRALQLPVRTYNTACVYFHKFRLVHPANEYDGADAAAAALFTACKIEDTLKKSRDILAAAHNLKHGAADYLPPDDPMFEAHSRTIVGLERLMLEASGFDFRNRYPQKMLMKLVKSCNLDRDTVGVTAYKVSLDLYRTFAPLKQTTQTMALACLELAIRLQQIEIASVTTQFGFDYDKWATTREEVMETLLDVLALYTYHQTQTIVGPCYTLSTFVDISIALRNESKGTEQLQQPNAKDAKENKKNATNGSLNGHKSPPSPIRGNIGERGKDGTVRFMLDQSRARDEKACVREFFEEPKEIEEYVY